MGNILTVRRALYFSIAVLLYGTLGVAAALVHKWRISGTIEFWRSYGNGTLIGIPERFSTVTRYHIGPSITVLVWAVVSSLYLIGFYLAPVSPSLKLEIGTLGALLVQGVISLGYLTTYWRVFDYPPNKHGVWVNEGQRDVGIATLVLGWVTVALIGALVRVLFIYGYVQRDTLKAEEVWPRTLIDLVDGTRVPTSPVDEYERLIPAREREPEAEAQEPSGLAAIFSPNALRTLAYAVVGLTAAATLGLDATLVHWFRKDNGFDHFPHRHLPGGHPQFPKYDPHQFLPGGPIAVLVFASVTTLFILIRPRLPLNIGLESSAIFILTTLGITNMSVLSTYWPLFNPYQPRALTGVGIATLIVGWIAAGALLFLLVLELLVVLRSVRGGVEGVWKTTFTDLVAGKTLWWVYVPEEHPSWYAQLSGVAAEREAEASRSGEAPAE